MKPLGVLFRVYTAFSVCPGGRGPLWPYWHLCNLLLLFLPSQKCYKLFNIEKILQEGVSRSVVTCKAFPFFWPSAQATQMYLYLGGQGRVSCRCCSPSLAAPLAQKTQKITVVLGPRVPELCVWKAGVHWPSSIPVRGPPGNVTNVEFAWKLYIIQVFPRLIVVILPYSFYK